MILDSFDIAPSACLGEGPSRLTLWQRLCKYMTSYAENNAMTKKYKE